LGTDLFSRYLKNQKSSWLKVSKIRFKKIATYFKHVSFFFVISKRNEKHRIFGRMNSMETPLKKIKMKGFIYVIMLLYILHQSHQCLYKTQQKREILKEGGGAYELLTSPILPAT
jgi:hypothetical protein